MGRRRYRGRKGKGRETNNGGNERKGESSRKGERREREKTNGVKGERSIQ